LYARRSSRAVPKCFPFLAGVLTGVAREGEVGSAYRADLSKVTSVMSSSCSQPSPVKE
jgi:hypothetical protein